MIDRVIKNAIVSGGTGVTGNALIRYLLDKGINVTALVRKESPRYGWLPVSNNRLKVISCNLDEFESVGKTLKDTITYDVFFHLAWDGSRGVEKVSNRDNYKLQTCNILHSLGAVELCKSIGCKLFVMTGSQAEYGIKYKAISEDDIKDPVNGYGMAKLCAESMTREACRAYGIEHIWPILFSVYGPNDGTESMIDISIRNIIEGERTEYTSGEQMWNYLYSYDAAKALLLLAQKGRSYEFYNVASSRNIPLYKYILEMYDTISPNQKPLIGARVTDSLSVPLAANISKLVNDTGFTEDYTFSEGIKEIYDSFAQ